MLVREAVGEDVAAITGIQNALIATTTYEWTEQPHTVEGRAAWLEAKRAAGEPVLVAVDEEGVVVGWATHGDFRDSRRWPGYRRTVEHTVHVAESGWGRGVGRLLVEALADVARAAGKRVQVAAIDGSNEPSIAFHLRLGFVETGRMPGVGTKWDRPLTLVLMQRDL